MGGCCREETAVGIRQAFLEIQFIGDLILHSKYVNKPSDQYFNPMSLPFTVTEPLERIPTFPELQALAKEYEIQINGNELAGDFVHSKATGKYIFENNGIIHGDFIGHHMLVRITGEFVLTTGTAAVTVSDANWAAKLNEESVKSGISKGLKTICAKFPPLA